MHMLPHYQCPPTEWDICYNYGHDCVKMGIDTMPPDRTISFFKLPSDFLPSQTTALSSVLTMPLGLCRHLIPANFSYHFHICCCFISFFELRELRAPPVPPKPSVYGYWCLGQVTALPLPVFCLIDMGTSMLTFSVLSEHRAPCI